MDEEPISDFEKALFGNRQREGAKRIPLPTPNLVASPVLHKNFNDKSNQSFPLPLADTTESQEFERLRERIECQQEIIDTESRKNDLLLSEIDKLKQRIKEIGIENEEEARNRERTFQSENKKLNDEVKNWFLIHGTLSETITEQERINSHVEKQVADLKSQNELLTNELEIHRTTNEDLKNELEKVNLDKVKSESEKLELIESLTFEKDELIQESTTIKMLNAEMTEEIETLKLLNSELCSENQNKPEPEVHLENELEDTTCTICTEEMKLKKCTPCRRRYHKSCIDNWLNEHRSCPTCRAVWND